jgi:hypothetical protein
MAGESLHGWREPAGQIKMCPDLLPMSWQSQMQIGAGHKSASQMPLIVVFCMTIASFVPRRHVWIVCRSFGPCDGRECAECMNHVCHPRSLTHGCWAVTGKGATASKVTITFPQQLRSLEHNDFFCSGLLK